LRTWLDKEKARRAPGFFLLGKRGETRQGGSCEGGGSRPHIKEVGGQDILYILSDNLQYISKKFFKEFTVQTQDLFLMRDGRAN
jgi:hypothetical protein